MRCEISNSQEREEKMYLQNTRSSEQRRKRIESSSGMPIYRDDADEQSVLSGWSRQDLLTRTTNNGTRRIPSMSPRRIKRDNNDFKRNNYDRSRQQPLRNRVGNAMKKLIPSGALRRDDEKTSSLDNFIRNNGNKDRNRNRPGTPSRQMMSERLQKIEEYNSFNTSLSVDTRQTTGIHTKYLYNNGKTDTTKNKQRSDLERKTNSVDNSESGNSNPVKKHIEHFNKQNEMAQSKKNIFPIESLHGLHTCQCSGSNCLKLSNMNFSCFIEKDHGDNEPFRKYICRTCQGYILIDVLAGSGAGSPKKNKNKSSTSKDNGEEKDSCTTGKSSGESEVFEDSDGFFKVPQCFGKNSEEVVGDDEFFDAISKNSENKFANFGNEDVFDPFFTVNNNVTRSTKNNKSKRKSERATTMTKPSHAPKKELHKTVFTSPRGVTQKIEFSYSHNSSSFDFDDATDESSYCSKSGEPIRWSYSASSSISGISTHDPEAYSALNSTTTSPISAAKELDSPQTNNSSTSKKVEKYGFFEGAHQGPDLVPIAKTKKKKKKSAAMDFTPISPPSSMGDSDISSRSTMKKERTSNNDSDHINLHIVPEKRLVVKDNYKRHTLTTKKKTSSKTKNDTMLIESESNILRSNTNDFMMHVAAIMIQAETRRFLGEIRGLERRWAVCVIQCTIRRFLAQLEASDRMWAIHMIQWNWRKARGKRLLLGNSNDKKTTQRIRGNTNDQHQPHYREATIIQSAFRGWMARDNFLIDRFCVIQLQRVIRGFLVRRYDVSTYINRQQERDQHTASAIIIQSEWRRYYGFFFFRFKRIGAIVIQASFRRHLVQKDLERKNAAATTIQAKWRSHMGIMIYLTTLTDVVIVQSIARRLLTQRRLLLQYIASIIIQSHWRSFHCRSLYKAHLLSVRKQKQKHRQKIIQQQARERSVIRTMAQTGQVEEQVDRERALRTSSLKRMKRKQSMKLRSQTQIHYTSLHVLAAIIIQSNWRAIQCRTWYRDYLQKTNMKRRQQKMHQQRETPAKDYLKKVRITKQKQTSSGKKEISSTRTVTTADTSFSSSSTLSPQQSKNSEKLRKPQNNRQASSGSTSSTHLRNDKNINDRRKVSSIWNKPSASSSLSTNSTTSSNKVRRSSRRNSQSYTNNNNNQNGTSHQIQKKSNHNIRAVRKSIITIEYTAAIIIQAHFRRYIVYKQLILKHVAAIIIQAHVRRHICTNRLIFQHYAVMIIQTRWRTYDKSLKFMFALADILLIQCVARRYIARRRVKRMKLMMNQNNNNNSMMMRRRHHTMRQQQKQPNHRQRSTYYTNRQSHTRYYGH